jgi:hypothetical protein
MEFGAMSSVKYIIAKHVPDVFRKEPRNIGVIVWSDFGVESRFWGVDSFGFIDGRRVPEFVNSKNAYEQWIAYWLKELKKPEIKSPDFLKFIQGGNSANYFIDDGGSILEQIKKEELPKLADEIFESVVTAEVVDEPDTTKLINEACEEVIKTTRLANNIHLYRQRLLHTSLGPNVVEPIVFSYCYGNGEPLWLGQQVALRRYKSQLAKEVDSICWRFEKVIKAGFITNEQGAAFVCPTDEQVDDRDVMKAIEVLGTVTNVINLRDEGVAKSEFNKVASIPVPAH